MAMNKIRVLVVDDTALYRKIIRDVLSDFSEVDVVGSAPNGKIALSKIETLKPDLITLDQEMPEIDGMETLRQIKARNLNVAAIMVSAHTTKGAKITVQALDLGAFDFIAKPDSNDINTNIESLKTQFGPKIEALQNRLGKRLASTKPVPEPIRTLAQAAPLTPEKGLGIKGKPKIIAFGVSTGGPKALAEVIPRIPATIGVPIVIVQHMPPVFTKALADSLDKKSQIKVVEGTDGQILQAGTAYIAPGGKQMKIAAGPGGTNLHLVITDDAPENHCKPAVDYLFRSVSNVYPGYSLAVIMTGMGRDGTLGLRLLKRQGAHVLAQNESTCVVYGMPMEAIKAGVVDEVLPLSSIAGKITGIIGSN